MEQFALFFGTIIAAAFGTLTGFGVATLLMPFAVFFLEFREALLFVALVHFAAASSRAWVFRKWLDWRLIIHFAIPNVLFAAAGAFVATELPVEVLQKIFAGALFLYALFGFLKPRFTLPQNRLVFWSGGSLTGLSAGLVGMGGAIRSAILGSIPLSKEQYLAASGAIPVIAEFGRTGVYLARGVRLEKELLLLLPFLIASAYCTVFIIEKFVRRVPPRLFRSIVFVSLMGVAMFFFFGSK